uniref:Uncharacterized protein n=1 Tax=uncultured Desulfobacterium sp. TaxID=201089 RepID=E1Y9H9_9BACT|nr:unknown protein [uncultured Desulfobacterium sp.]
MKSWVPPGSFGQDKTFYNYLNKKNIIVGKPAMFYNMDRKS